MSALAMLAGAFDYAAQAVRRGPHTSAPPSFDGRGWLVVINLTVFTAGFYLLLMLSGWLIRQMWRYRRVDRWSDPVSIHRRVGLLWSIGFALRCFAEAYSVWAWDPTSPSATGTALEVKRFLDPVAAAIGGTGMVIFALSLRGMTPQLRKRPFPIDMWASLPMLRRPAIIVLLCFGAAIGVASTR